MREVVAIFIPREYEYSIPMLKLRLTRVALYGTHQQSSWSPPLSATIVTVINAEARGVG